MRRRICALLCACAVALGGCSTPETSDEPGDVAVNGDFGSPVTLTITGTITPADDVLAETLIAGDGSTIVENGPVLLRATSFDSRTGSVISDYSTGTIRMTTANDEGLGDVAGYVMDAQEGTRLLIERPGLLDGSADAVEIIVIDVLHTMALGEAAPAPEPLPAGMPSIETLDSGAPHVASGGGKIPSLAVVPVIAGTGAQVSAEDTLIIQYVITDTDANLIDTTWNGQGPVTVSLGGVMKGLQEGLTDQKVGSRVAVLIPSSEASGEGDRIAVVDILAIAESPAE